MSGVYAADLALAMTQAFGGSPDAIREAKIYAAKSRFLRGDTSLTVFEQELDVILRDAQTEGSLK